ncbi:MAG: hypothetical protein AB7J32_08540 [Pseudonocardia sp.]
MTLLLIIATLGLAVFWRQAAVALGVGLLVLLALGIVKVAELMQLTGH